MPNIIVNGIGTIGKRVAEAIKKQPDMELMGIADVAPNTELITIKKNFLEETPVYASTEKGVEKIEEAGIKVEGKLKDVISEVDLVVDATPSGIDMKNKENLYEPNNVKAVFQGGSDSEIAPVSFNAEANFEDAKGKDFVRVVSCNTTSLCRTLKTVDENFEIEKVTANLVRRGGDPKQDSRGPINSIIPVTHVPSHHGPDVQEVMPYIDITTLAVKVPTTLSHVHMVTVELKEDKITSEDAIKAFQKDSRINLLSAEDGFNSTAKVMEKMRDMHRERNDMNEVGVWKETVTVDNGKLYWIHMTHQESIVIPDNIDAIRAMLDMENKETSIKKTNKALGI